MTEVILLSVPILFGVIVLWLQKRGFDKRDVWIKSLKIGDLVLYRGKERKIKSFSPGLYFNSERFYEDNPDEELRNKLTVLLEGEYRFVPIGDIKPVKK